MSHHAFKSAAQAKSFHSASALRGAHPFHPGTVRGYGPDDVEVSLDAETEEEGGEGERGGPSLFEDNWDDETFADQRPPMRESASVGLSELDLNRWRQKPVEDKYRIQVERGISEERRKELGVEFWSVWSSPGPCAYPWEWRADEQVFVKSGTLRVTPAGCDGAAVFGPGDLVRFPKWLFAELEIGGNYEQHYRFRAYGDDN